MVCPILSLLCSLHHVHDFSLLDKHYVIIGIAGASYIPAVEAALPRLLGAAAPPGASARENRRQCHKVILYLYYV